MRQTMYWLCQLPFCQGCVLGRSSHWTSPATVKPWLQLWEYQVWHRERREQWKWIIKLAATVELHGTSRKGSMKRTGTLTTGMWPAVELFTGVTCTPEELGLMFTILEFLIIPNKRHPFSCKNVAIWSVWVGWQRTWKKWTGSVRWTG